MAVIITAMPVFASGVTSTHSLSFLVKKFGIAMGGVFLFSFILYLGLTIYNKFFVAEQIKDFQLRKDSLRNPRDKEEAILMFIAKNKLK